jgi:prephenate dehydrogenase
MWRDICLANGDAIQLMLEHFFTDLQELTEAIQNRDGQHLLDIFSSAKAARDRFVKK